jgi:hypothetical protein
VTPRVLFTAALALVACSSPAEDACTLTFERIAMVEPPPGDEGFAGWHTFSPELPGKRRAVIAMERAEPPILVYDARGGFTDTLGTVGSGPGEYRRPQLVLPYRGDSILVIDREHNRATILDSALRVGRSFPLTFPVLWGAALADGSMALSHGMGTGQRVGRFGPEGEPLDDPPWSFARAFAERTNEPWLHVGAEPDGSWWTLSLNMRFEFRHYDAHDSLLGAWELPRDLLPPYEEHVATSPSTPPHAGIDAGYVDSRKRLWAFARVADSQWVEGLGPKKRVEGQDLWPTSDPHALWDGLVIVVSRDSGQVLRTWRLDSVPGSPIEAGVLLTTSEDDDGWYHSELRRPVPSPACGLD